MKHYAIAVLLCVILSVSLFAAAESHELFDFSGTILYSQEEVVSNPSAMPAYENEAVLVCTSEQNNSLNKYKDESVIIENAFTVGVFRDTINPVLRGDCLFILANV